MQFIVGDYMRIWRPTRPTSLPPRWRSREERCINARQRLERAEAALNFELAAFRLKAALIRHAELQAKAGFRRNQPRWLAGSGRISGRWSGGVGTGPPGIGHNSAEPTRGGHHFVPRKIFDNEPFQPETRRVFDQSRTGPLKGGPHGNSKEHTIYNGAVYDHYKRFLRENRIGAEDMTPDQARKLLDEVKRSSDPRIRDFNLRIFRREVLYQLRRIPRGNE